MNGLLGKDVGRNTYDLTSAIGKIETKVYKELDITLSEEEAVTMFYSARDFDKFSYFLEWIKDDLKPYPKPFHVMWLLRYFNSKRSMVPVNREDRIGNRRTNLW